MGAIQAIYTNRAPKPIGPYSQGVLAHGEFLFLSGQIALTEEGTINSEDVGEQTRQVLTNIMALLSAAEYSLEHVVKTTVFLKDMNDFAHMNEVYAEYLGETKPARSTVEVARLPKDAKVEIEIIAVR